MPNAPKPTLKLILAAACLLAAPRALAANVEQVAPSAADQAVRQFDEPSLVLTNGPADQAAPLVVFLPGTHGRSENAPRLLLDTIAQLGYRVIFLTYDDAPSVSQTCPPQPDPDCAAKFRQMRTFGASDGPVRNPTAEAIVPRLTALLRYLKQAHPQAGWDGFLTPGGQPVWGRIVVSGLSQGAGMAAYIAKRVAVRRVVLFSSPWDNFGPAQTLAPWLSEPSATPPQLWWAERHVRERTTALLARAYQTLAIPPDHILLFNGSPPQRVRPAAGNPYHTSTTRLAEYVDQWRRMYGKAAGG